MITKTIKYQNWDGDDSVKTCHFHIRQQDLTQMIAENMELEGGNTFIQLVEGLGQSTTALEVLVFVRQLVDLSYGVKDEDYFEQTPELTKRFHSHLAYDELMFELSTDGKALAEFFKGVLPANLTERLETEAGKRGMTIEDLQDPEKLARFKAAVEAETAEGKDEDLSEKPKKPIDYSDQELLDMSDEDFKEVVGPEKTWDPRTLRIAYNRKTRS